MYIFIEPFCVCVVNTTDNKEVGPIYDNVATAQWLSVILLSLYTINPFTIVSEIRIKMILLYSNILFKGIINPKSNISCDDIYFSSEARGFYVFYGLSLLDPPFTCDGVIINMKVDNDFGYQIYCGMNGKMYGRAKYVPNFTNWTEM